MVSHRGGASAAGATVPPSTPASGGSSTRTRTVARSSTTSQPTAMRPFIVSRTPWDSSALSSTTVLAQDRDSPKIRPAPGSQPHHQAMPMPSRVATAHLHHRTGQGDPFHREQVIEREMQPDAEHQQHDADLGQLGGGMHIGDEARRRRADDDAG